MTPSEPEQDFGIDGPSYLAGGEMPLPGGDLRHFQRHPKALFILANALVRSGQGRRALVDSSLEFLVGQSQPVLSAFPFGHLALQRVVEIGKRPRLAKDIDKDRDLRAQNRGIDRLAQIVDRISPSRRRCSRSPCQRSPPRLGSRSRAAVTRNAPMSASVRDSEPRSATVLAPTRTGSRSAPRGPGAASAAA